uniref:Uncharacterized protein n=1 Tax=viral metagenome TaxID=1070528 RepID=A0A6C0D6W2_9ZZZZ
MKSRTRKYKHRGGQLSENIVRARSRLRSTSPNQRRYREGTMGRRSNSSGSTLSLESLASNISDDGTFKVGDKYFSLVENPETGRKDLFVWDSLNNTWVIDQNSKVGAPRSRSSSISSNEGLGFFGGRRLRHKRTRKNKFSKYY